jgi:hypothetical protein
MTDTLTDYFQTEASYEWSRRRVISFEKKRLSKMGFIPEDEAH